jgi:hypothetical protein
MVRFNTRQEEILEIAKKKGYLTLQDFITYYSSPISRKANLDRFLAMGILTSKVMGRFELNKEVLENYTKNE